jgi:hypothetical protein
LNSWKASLLFFTWDQFAIDFMRRLKPTPRDWIARFVVISSKMFINLPLSDYVVIISMWGTLSNSSLWSEFGSISRDSTRRTSSQSKTLGLDSKNTALFI